MRLYRICPEKYLEDYSGLGASYRDGARWNRSGQPALYFATSPSVAMLEMANYLPSPRLVPAAYRLGIYEIDRTAPVETWHLDELPEDWNHYPYPRSTQHLGGAWLDRAEAVFLRVPSAAVPGGLEDIVLMNPRHPQAPGLQFWSAESEIFSDRIFSER